jgi:hypothetical protein
MHWLTQILESVFPRPSGLEVDESDPLAFRLPLSPAGFFRALALLVGPGATLYWEGHASRTLASWLNRYTSEPAPAVSVGVTPVHDFYHLPLIDDVLDQLATRVAEPGALRGRVRIHVHEGGRIILQWHPAFSKSPLLLSRRIQADRVQAFVTAADATPVRRPAAI